MTAPDNAVVGRQLARWRTHAHVTQQQLAEHLGYRSRTSIAMIEAGEKPLALADAYRVAELLGIDVGTFLEERPPADRVTRHIRDRKEGHHPMAETPQALADGVTALTALWARVPAEQRRRIAREWIRDGSPEAPNTALREISDEVAEALLELEQLGGSPPGSFR